MKTISLLINSNDLFEIKNEYINLDPEFQVFNTILVIPTTINDNCKDVLKCMLTTDSEEYLTSTIIEENDDGKIIRFDYSNDFVNKYFNDFIYEDIIEMIRFFECIDCKKLLSATFSLGVGMFNIKISKIIDDSNKNLWERAAVFSKE